MPLFLPRFRREITLVDKNGRPTSAFHQWWDRMAKNIEESFNDLTEVVSDISDLQAEMALRIAEIEEALAAANAAQADATAAAREAARLNSYPAPNSVLSAEDVGTDCTITIDAHTRVYPVQGSIDVPDVSITSGTVTGLAFETDYWIYYDDETLISTTPTFQATTSSATAMVGAAAGRHYVGFITTPADGASGTGGIGGTPPGGYSNTSTP